MSQIGWSKSTQSWNSQLFRICEVDSSFEVEQLRQSKHRGAAQHCTKIGTAVVFGDLDRSHGTSGEMVQQFAQQLSVVEL